MFSARKVAGKRTRATLSILLTLLSPMAFRTCLLKRRLFLEVRQLANLKMHRTQSDLSLLAFAARASDISIASTSYRWEKQPNVIFRPET